MPNPTYVVRDPQGRAAVIRPGEYVPHGMEETVYHDGECLYRSELLHLGKRHWILVQTTIDFEDLADSASRQNPEVIEGGYEVLDDGEAYLWLIRTGRDIPDELQHVAASFSLTKRLEAGDQSGPCDAEGLPVNATEANGRKRTIEGQGPACPLELRGPNSKPLVNGEEAPVVTPPAAYAGLQALDAAFRGDWRRRLTNAELDVEAGKFAAGGFSGGTVAKALKVLLREVPLWTEAVVPASGKPTPGRPAESDRGWKLRPKGDA